MYQERGVKPRRIDSAGRFTLVALSRLCDWKDTLPVVQPKSLICWHREGFRIFWRWKSRMGRPRIPENLRNLIHKMARENPLRGEERIANELLVKLGIRISPRTVRKYMPKKPSRGPQNDQRSTSTFASFSVSNLSRVYVVRAFWTTSAYNQETHVPLTWHLRHHGTEVLLLPPFERFTFDFIPR